jgi:superfamily II DNA/RNA helicase
VVAAGDFAELGTPAALVAVLTGQGIEVPTPIQAATIADALAGRDVLGRARTGSGKTLAFALPTISSLRDSGSRRLPYKPRALVLVPTRELASQVSAVFAPLAKATGMRTTTVYGGVGQSPQVRALKDGIDVLVACPGRLEDLISQGRCALDAVEVTVLDEADHMADLGFLPAVTRLLGQTPRGTQRMFFSATLDGAVDGLARRFLDDPVTHSVKPVQAEVTTMTHHVFGVRVADKNAVVTELAAGQGRTLMFTRTKHVAKKWARHLTAAGIPAVDLHGNLSQAARERNLAAFSRGDVRVLVATDIAARGIHVEGVDLVVHVDPPAEHKAYLHRSGRTARAGATGTVVTLSTPDQRSDVRTLTKRAGIAVEPRSVAPGDAAIGELTGPAAPRVEPKASDRTRPDAQRNERHRKSPRSRSREAANRNAGSSAGARRDGGRAAEQRGSRQSSASAVSERGSRRGRSRRAA